MGEAAGGGEATRAQRRRPRQHRPAAPRGPRAPDEVTGLAVPFGNNQPVWPGSLRISPVPWYSTFTNLRCDETVRAKEPCYVRLDRRESQQQFDAIRHINPYGEEYWSARELMPLLGYDKWERFDDVIDRARAACENAGQ